MYSPPSNEYYKTPYDMGYNDAKNKKEYSEPYEPSNHERDTTYHDTLNFHYYLGYYDYEGE